MSTREPMRILGVLPAVFQQVEGAGGGEAMGPSYLEIFLAALDPVLAELEAGIDGLHHTFDPDHAPGGFLEWLGGWLALSFRADLADDRRRELIRRAVSLYRLRGTRRGLREMLEVHTGLAPSDVVVDEMSGAFQIGVTSRVGIDTLLGEGEPHFFRVRLMPWTTDAAQLRWYRDVAVSVIEGEKPAHTRYALEVNPRSLPATDPDPSDP